MRKNHMVVGDITAMLLASFDHRCMDKPRSELLCGEMKNGKD